jgi:hypothetical protein
MCVCMHAYGYMPCSRDHKNSKHQPNLHLCMYTYKNTCIREKQYLYHALGKILIVFESNFKFFFYCVYTTSDFIVLCHHSFLCVHICMYVYIYIYICVCVCKYTHQVCLYVCYAAFHIHDPTPLFSSIIVLDQFAPQEQFAPCVTGKILTMCHRTNSHHVSQEQFAPCVTGPIRTMGHLCNHTNSMIISSTRHEQSRAERSTHTYPMHKHEHPPTPRKMTTMRKMTTITLRKTRIKA